MKTILNKQTVYLPVQQGQITKTVIYDEGYFFTPEQLNEYTQAVIKEALETAAEKAEVKMEDYGIPAWSANYNPEIILNKKSITNTFEETYNKLKV